MKQTIIQLIESKRNFALEKKAEAEAENDAYSRGFWQGVALQANDDINLINIEYITEASIDEIAKRYANESD